MWVTKKVNCSQHPLSLSLWHCYCFYWGRQSCCTIVIGKLEFSVTAGELLGRDGCSTEQAGHKHETQLLVSQVSPRTAKYQVSFVFFSEDS